MEDANSYTIQNKGKYFRMEYYHVTKGMYCIERHILIHPEFEAIDY